jgi:hypothetical protein
VALGVSWVIPGVPVPVEVWGGVVPVDGVVVVLLGLVVVLPVEGVVLVLLSGVVPVTPPVVPAGVCVLVPLFMSGLVVVVPVVPVVPDWLVPMLPVVPVVD